MKCFNCIVAVVIIFFLTGCNTIDVYEKTTPVPHHEWSSRNRLNFTFNATDSLAYYNVYLVLRHTESYHFNNIWIDFSSAFTGQKPQIQRLNVTLADANGWLGAAMDDIIEQRILLFKNPTRLPAGTYTFSLQQVMREDPLENVLNAGVRVEKVVR